jgi:hypothetical protein
VRAVLIGERMNRRTYRPTRWPEVVQTERYWRLQLRFGLFRDGQGRQRLESLGLRWEDGLNLLPPDPQGVPWDAVTAREVAAAWLPRLRGYDVTYLCGGRVLDAFGVDRCGLRLSQLYGRPLDIGGALATCLPHPSGLNRWWNDPRNPERLKRRLRRAASA